MQKLHFCTNLIKCWFVVFAVVVFTGISFQYLKAVDFLGGEPRTNSHCLLLQSGKQAQRDDVTYPKSVRAGTRSLISQLAPQESSHPLTMLFYKTRAFVSSHFTFRPLSVHPVSTRQSCHTHSEPPPPPKLCISIISSFPLSSQFLFP